MTYPIQTERYAVFCETPRWTGDVPIQEVVLRPLSMSGLWDHVFSERWYYLWDVPGYPHPSVFFPIQRYWLEGMARWPGQVLECQMAVEYRACPQSWRGEVLREDAIAEAWSAPGKSNIVGASILTVTMAPLTMRELCSTTKTPSLM